jgi:hypothetical protein
MNEPFAERGGGEKENILQVIKAITRTTVLGLFLLFICAG